MALKTSNPKLTDIMLRNSQTKTYTVVGITILLTVIMIFFVIRPSIARILIQTAENKEREAIAAQLNEKYATLENLIKQEEQYDEQIDLFNDEIFPESRREDEFIANLAKGAEASNVTLLSIGVLEDNGQNQTNIALPANVKKYILTASIQGEREEIEKFTQFLEEFPRVINLTDVVFFRISAEEFRAGGSNKPYKADIKALVYSWQEVLATPTPVVTP